MLADAGEAQQTGELPSASIEIVQTDIWKKLREQLAVDVDSFSRALDGVNGDDLVGGNDKSGSLCVYSTDGLYIVKTVSASKKRVIEKKATAYFEHLREHTQSYLRHSACLGLFSIRLYG